MGLEEVKKEILQEAQEKADKKIEEAEERKEELISEAEEKADKILEETEEEIENEKESIRQKALSTARMEAKQEKLKVKEEYIDEVFEEFREYLSELSDDEKQAYVQSCLEKTEFEIGEVQGSSEFQDYVEEEGHDFEEADVDGIIVVSDDGNRKQNFSFDKIAKQFRDQYRKKVAGELFE